MKIEKYIITKAKDKSKLLDATQALANLYVDSGFTDEILVNRVLSEDELYVITFPKQPDFERFKYFVNYLHYPESGGFGTTTKGYWTIKAEDGIPEGFINSRVMLYVSENDTEYDNVFSAFDSTTDNYKLGFSSSEEFVKLSSSEPSFFEKLIDDNSFELLESITPDKTVLENRNKTKSKGIGCLMILPVILSITIALLIYVL
jgi:hypothetical protein